MTTIANLEKGKQSLVNRGWRPRGGGDDNHRQFGEGKKIASESEGDGPGVATETTVVNSRKG